MGTDVRISTGLRFIARRATTAEFIGTQTIALATAIWDLGENSGEKIEDLTMLAGVAR